MIELRQNELERNLMYKMLAALLIPLLITMPISEASRAYFLSQYCQNVASVQKLNCDCESHQNQFNILQESTCCCVKPNNNDKENIPLVSELKPIEFNLTFPFKLSKPYDLTKNINLIDNYATYYSSGISTAEKCEYYSPPIYQQNCSLRI